MGASPIAARRGIGLGKTTRNWDLLLTATAVYILTAVGRIHVMFSPLMVLKPTLLAASIALVALIADRAQIRSMRAMSNPVTRYLTFVMFWATLGAPFGIYLHQSVDFLTGEGYKLLALFVLVVAAVRNANDVRRLLIVYGASTVVLAVYALMHRSVDHAGRLGGTGGYDPNDLAMVLVSGLPVAIYLIGQARRPFLRAATAGAMVAIVLATLETESRGGFLAMGAVLLYSLFLMRGVKTRWRVAAAVGVIVFIVFAGSSAFWTRMGTIATPGQDYNFTSVTGRLAIWKRGIGYMFDNPVFGVGVGNFSSAEGRSPVIRRLLEQGYGVHWRPAHSAWVQMGAELGIPGLLAFVAAFIAACRFLWTESRRISEPGAAGTASSREIASALLGSMIGLMVAITMLTQAFGYAVWACFGLVAGLWKVSIIPSRWPSTLIRPGTRQGSPRGTRPGGQIPAIP